MRVGVTGPPILRSVARFPMDGDIKTCGKGQGVAGVGCTPHSIENGRMGVDELGMVPVRIWRICARSQGGVISHQRMDWA